MHFKRELPREAWIEDPTMEKCKKEAVEEMLEKLKKEWAEALKEACNASSYDSEDLEDPEADRLEAIREEQINGEFDLVQKFIEALPSCILLTLPVSAKMCFCPCSNKMEKW